ncbi:MAG: substrate-binding domain-containing protein [Planctomycetaceae bacterium]|nr:substrate-binding domain-containing protein [Planctomycetaceae bacterium]
MSEPRIITPFTSTTAGYVFLTTLWVIFVPGAIAHIVFIPLLWIGVLAAYPFRVEVLFWIFFWTSLAFCVFLFYRSLKVPQHLQPDHWAERVHRSFTLRIFPFWLPLFWGLVVTAISFYNATTSFSSYNNGGFFGFPQYVLLFLAAAFSGGMDFFMMASSIANLLVAIAGTVHVVRVAPPVRKTRGLTLCTAITLLLCGLTGLAYYHFRTEILSPANNSDEIVRDERGRNLYYTSDTDLTEYIPFTENNKLVKIELPTLTVHSEHPKLHGAFALYPIYAAAVESMYDIRGDMTFDDPDREWGNAHVKVGTSPQAFNALLNVDPQRRSDMVFMLQPSEKQLQEAKDKGIALVITPIGYEAFVFFVSTVNPVDGLTLDQIRDIYSKRTTRWNDLGGRNERILPFQRPEGSGSQTAMLRVMGDVPIPPPLREEFRHGMGIIVASVADYRNYGNAIGFSFRYYVEGLFKHDGVKLLNIDGIAPTIENIQNGT